MKLKYILWALLGFLCFAYWNGARAQTAPVCPIPTNIAQVKVFVVPAGVSSYSLLGMTSCPDPTKPGYIFTPGMYFNLSEVLPYLIQQAAGTFSAAQAMVDYMAAQPTFTPLSAAEKLLIRQKAVDEFGVTPVVLTPIAYKQRKANGVISWFPYGKVAVGTPCTPMGKAGDKMPVPRDAVTKNSALDTHPDISYADCG